MNADLIAALNAERYGTGEWFTGKPRRPTNEDDDLTTARRRREAAADLDRLNNRRTA